MNTDYKGTILREQVRLAMQQLPTMLVTNLICASVLGLAAWKIAAPGKILLWVSMVLVIHLSRSVLYFEFRKARDASFNGEYWRDIYLASNLTSGVIWGTSAFMIFPSIDHPGRMFIFLLVIIGVAAASTVSHSTLKLGPAAWSAPAVTAYALRCCMDGGELGYTIALLGVLFLFTVIIYGVKHNRFITSGIVLRFENLELLEEVRTVNHTISQEIAERKLAQKALEESEEKFRLVFQTSPDAINLSRVSDGMCIDINEGFTKLTGYTRDDVIGKTSQELNIRHDPKDRERFRAQLESSGFVENMETEFRSKDGRILTGLLSARVLRVNQEDVVLGIIRDITARKKAEEEKKRLEAKLTLAQKMESVGRLAGGVAHDFNNMLSVIIGRAEMTLHSSILDDRVRKNLNEIIHAGHRSAELTRQLLAFASKQPTTPKIVDLNDTISGMLLMLHRLIGEDIDLSWKPGSDLRKVRIDPSQIDQILVNLVVNARDSISGKGSITVRTDNFVVEDAAEAGKPELMPGRYVLLAVNDTGAGMTREVRGKIFEPFFTTKELGKGTGLGLSTVYGIVKQNNGFIDVVSEPGKGATFKICLPGFENGAAPAPEKKASGNRPTGAETILLVEDNEVILDLSKGMLEMLGYTVIATHAPESAITLAQTHPGDIGLLITDVIMPEMNGRELADTLGQIRPGVKSLFMSGHAADVLGSRGILEEGVNFIQKPFGSDEFAQKVRQVLDRLDAASGIVPKQLDWVKLAGKK